MRRVLLRRVGGRSYRGKPDHGLRRIFYRMAVMGDVDVSVKGLGLRADRE
jgi:hypothetical protein